MRKFKICKVLLVKAIEDLTRAGFTVLYGRLV